MNYFLGVAAGLYPPLLFSLVVGLALLLYGLFRWYKVLLYAQLIMILVIPTVLQWVCGGFAKSGAVILWAILAPFGATLFVSPRQSIVWFAAFILLVAVSIYFDQWFDSSTPAVPAFSRLFFFSMNLIVTSSVLFAGMLFYGTQNDREHKTRLRITNQLSDGSDILLNSIASMARGDLRNPVLFASSGKSAQHLLQPLFDGLNRAIQLISQLIMELQEAQSQADAVAGEMITALDQLNAGLQAQSAGVNEIDSISKEFQQETRSVLNLIETGARKAEHNVGVANEGSRVIEATVAKINEISASMNETSASVAELEQHVAAIDQVISTINDIADKTALLALNASIEAARAGEHGRGFAVVANEISHLTAMTTDSTRQITRQIQNIQRTTGMAVNRFKINHGLSAESVQMAGQIKNSILAIINTSGILKENYQQILEKSMQHNQSLDATIQQIQTLLGRIKDYLQQVDAMSSQTGELKLVLAGIKQGMAKFKV
ncbi:MAG: hypothetical protein KDK39_14230 [Leptospiraceae bacterium]|nr:hypothetical protein [Leptospiraceae bacterium]